MKNDKRLLRVYKHEEDKKGELVSLSHCVEYSMVIDAYNRVYWNGEEMCNVSLITNGKQIKGFAKVKDWEAVND